jgi:hypothetical protein
MTAFFTGPQIQGPRLDVRAAMMPGQMIGDALASVGKAIGDAKREKQRKEEKAQEYKDLGESLYKSGLVDSPEEGVAMAKNPQVYNSAIQLKHAEINEMKAVAEQKAQERQLQMQQAAMARLDGGFKPQQAQPQIPMLQDSPILPPQQEIYGPQLPQIDPSVVMQPAPQAQQITPSPTVNLTTPEWNQNLRRIKSDVYTAHPGMTASEVNNMAEQIAVDRYGPKPFTEKEQAEQSKAKTDAQRAKYALESGNFNGVKVVGPGWELEGRARSTNERDLAVLSDIVYKKGNPIQLMNEIENVWKKKGRYKNMTFFERLSLIHSKTKELQGRYRTEVVGPGAVTETEWKILEDVVAAPTDKKTEVLKKGLAELPEELRKKIVFLNEKDPFAQAARFTDLKDKAEYNLLQAIESSGLKVKGMRLEDLAYNKALGSSTSEVDTSGLDMSGKSTSQEPSAPALVNGVSLEESETDPNRRAGITAIMRRNRQAK